MARQKKADVGFDGSLDDLVEALKATTGALQQSEKKIPHYGVDMPLVASWLFGGPSTFPVGRKLQLSGIHKSFKSTLAVEIGSWFIAQGGIHITIDTEGKTSSAMHDAMSWRHPNEAVRSMRRRLYKGVSSIEEWQQQVTDMIEMARKTSGRPKGQRVPIFCVVDSVSAVTSEGAMEDIRKEGHAVARQFPIAAMQTSNFIPAIRLEKTAAALGFVHHVRQQMDGHGETEKGAGAVHYQSSILLRMKRIDTLRMASHSGAPMQGPPVEGYTVNIKQVYGCLGPDGRQLKVDILWQYIPDPETGLPRQVMWYDWDGALGRLLRDFKYSDKSKLYEYERDQLNEALMFTQPKANTIKCEELGLEAASLSEFGAAINANFTVRDRIARLLGVVTYPNVQDIDEID